MRKRKPQLILNGRDGRKHFQSREKKVKIFSISSEIYPTGNSKYSQNSKHSEIEKPQSEI